MKVDQWVNQNEIQKISDKDEWFGDTLSPNNSPTTALLVARWRHGFSSSSPKDVLAYFDNTDNPIHYRSLYVEFCGIIAASVEVERLWSKAGQIFSDKRNRMKDETLSRELFLKMNRKVPTPEKHKSHVEDFKKIKISELSLNIQPSDIEKAFGDIVEVIQQAEDDASEIDCEEDEDLKEIVHEAEEFDSEEASVCKVYFSCSSYRIS